MCLGVFLLLIVLATSPAHYSKNFSCVISLIISSPVLSFCSGFLKHILKTGSQGLTFLLLWSLFKFSPSFWESSLLIFLSNFFFNLFIYLFIYGCVGSSFLREGLLQLRQAGATLHRGARASHYRGLSCCGAQAPDAQAQ